MYSVYAAAVTGCRRALPSAAPSQTVSCGQRGIARRAGRGARLRLPRFQAGLSYVEVLVATLLIMVALAPALEALAPGVAGAGIHASRAEDHYAVAGRLEQLLGETYTDLDAAALAAGSAATPTSYSESVVLPGGRRVTRNVFLARYDSDNADGDDDPFTGAESDLLWVRVVIAESGVALETLVSAYD